jgi:excisionase family DNA binding protein
MRTFDVDRAAKFLNISPDTMKDLAQNGVVPGAKIGKGWVFTDEDLSEFLRGEIRKQTAERIAEKQGGKPAVAPEETTRMPTTYGRAVLGKGRRVARTPPSLSTA